MAKSISGYATTQSIVAVVPDKIKLLDNYNVRDTFDSKADSEDRELKASLKAQGYRGAPLIVRIVGTDVYLVAGHRRYAAIRELMAEGMEWKSIPCMAEEKTTDDATRTLDLITSNSGKQLNAAERGAVFIRLRGMGWNVGQIAAKAGCTTKWVAECTALARADVRLLALVKAKILSPTLAVETLRQHGADATTVVQTAVDAAKAKSKPGAQVRITGKDVSAAGGKSGKADQKAARTAARNGTAPEVQVVPEAGKKAASKPTGYAAMLACLAGPFTQGADLDDCDIIDGNGAVFATAPDEGQAKAAIFLLNHSWHTFRGTTAVQARTAPAVAPAGKAPLPVVIAAKANGAAKAPAGKGK